MLPCRAGGNREVPEPPLHALGCWSARRSVLKRKKIETKLARADTAAMRAMEPWSQAPGLSHVASLGDQPQLRTLSIALFAAGLAAGSRSEHGPRLMRAGARMLAAHTLATLAKDFVKRRVDRTRPRSLDDRSTTPLPKPGRDDAKEETSFPSGHAAGAAAVARAFCREYPELAGTATGAAAIVSLVQVPRCAHYPSDTAAGLAIGLAAEAVTDAAARGLSFAARKARAAEPLRTRRRTARSRDTE
jgi:membrane-associated phospholipid phosphatase